MSNYDDYMERFRNIINEGFISLPTPIAENWKVPIKIVAASSPVGVSTRSGIDAAKGIDYSTLENLIWPNPEPDQIKLTK